MIENFYVKYKIGGDGTFGLEGKGLELIDIEIGFLTDTEDI